MIQEEKMVYQEKNIENVVNVVFGLKLMVMLIIVMIVIFVLKDMIIIVLGLVNVLEKIINIFSMVLWELFS